MTDKRLAPIIISITPVPVAREPNCVFSFNKAIPNEILPAPKITKDKIWITTLSRLGEMMVRTI